MNSSLEQVKEALNCVISVVSVCSGAPKWVRPRFLAVVPVVLKIFIEHGCGEFHQLLPSFLELGWVVAVNTAVELVLYLCSKCPTTIESSDLVLHPL